MSELKDVFRVLKQELKVRSKTYLHIAEALCVSEARVKQMFSREDIKLDRLKTICTEVLQISLTDFFALVEERFQYSTTLTEEQEKFLSADMRLMSIAISVMNNWKLSEILDQFNITEAECFTHLETLRKLKLISFKPDGEVKLLIDRNFRPIPGGKLDRLYQQIQTEFLQSHFDEPNQKRILVTGMLSQRSSDRLITLIEKLVDDFFALNADDMRLELQNRVGNTLLVAVRPWQMQAFAEMRKQPAIDKGSNDVI